MFFQGGDLFCLPQCRFLRFRANKLARLAMVVENAQGDTGIFIKIAGKVLKEIAALVTRFVTAGCYTKAKIKQWAKRLLGKGDV